MVLLRRLASRFFLCFFFLYPQRKKTIQKDSTTLFHLFAPVGHFRSGWFDVCCIPESTLLFFDFHERSFYIDQCVEKQKRQSQEVSINFCDMHHEHIDFIFFTLNIHVLFITLMCRYYFVISVLYRTGVFY